MKKHGFTLIELLIVVAIIAILAAIAVPNFLEAQVRAKISRVHADMRSIATAIEAYRVDYNVPPPGGMELFYCPPKITPKNEAYGHSITLLTTPVAFMSSVPEDPFRQIAGHKVGDKYWGLKIIYYESLSRRLAGPTSTASGQVKTLVGALSSGGCSWALHCVGPSTIVKNDEAFNLKVAIFQFAPQHPAANDYLYDSTNGTKSEGYIIRTSAGIITK